MTIHPHGPLVEVADNLWQVKGTLPAVPIERNMTVFRTKDRRLVLYSVVAMDDAGMTALERLGTPAYMVIPHLRHHMDVPFYKARYPQLRVIAPEWTPVDGVTIDGGLDELAQFDIRAGVVPGSTHQDVVLDFPLSNGRALCVCELLVHPPTTMGGMWSLVAKIFGPPGGGFGIARAVRLREVRDPKRVKRWLEWLAQRTDLRLLLVGHGEPIMRDVPSALLRAATQV